MTCCVQEGGSLCYAEGIDTDPFLRAFFSEICNRPSCYACKFKRRYRPTDMTIWDCFDASCFETCFSDDSGASKVLTHSPLGVEIADSLASRGHLVPVDVDALVRGEKEMIASVPMNPNRTAFLRDCREIEDPSLLFSRWFPQTLRTRLERFARRLLARIGALSRAKRLAKRALRR